MVVVVGRHLLVARAPVAEIMARQDARLLEQADGAIDGGNADMRIDFDGTRATMRRCSVIFSFLSMHSCSKRETISWTM
jgi:hypothetical protein